YPWAYWPLAIVAQAVALVGLCASAPSPLPRLGLSPLAIALGCFLLAGTIQLVPLPLGIIRAVSPDAPDVIAQLDPLVAAGLATTHPLSLSPRSTLRGLAVLGSLAFLVIGGARLFSIAGARRSAQAIALVGVALALVGIIQRPLHAGKIYGFWTPAGGGNPFGPFVNKNHFAGWMLMTVPLTLGVAGATAARSIRRAEMDFRARVLWLSSPEASRIVLWIAASALMALSVILTLSRSGIVVLALVAMLMAARALRSQQTTGRRIAALVVASALAIGIVAWIGVDVIAARFGEANWDDLNDRQGAWLDAVRIIRLYPLAGTGFNTYGVATLFYQQHN
ncbi:MAG TPA: O-antigen ligase family protein, partial [Ktedonobacterales bacterium]|nr:O-antigen ligase family protein [Ktedonobacterales bacterium]